MTKLYQFRLHRSGWGVGSRESSVGECGIIDIDFIIPMQPETILREETGFLRPGPILKKQNKQIPDFFKKSEI